MMPLPSLSFSSSSSATSGIKGDASQGGSTAGGGGSHGGFTNNFAGIGSQLAAGSPQLMGYIALGLVALVAVWWIWKR
jgi:hypothetical protein